jgi:16S rRNA (cytosine967-C5)-methyltransferase
MKIHRVLAEAVVQSLSAIFVENRYADKVIEKTLKQNPKWGARDRRFIAETTYDIVRWKRLYQAITQSGDSDFWKWMAVWIVERDFELADWKEFSTVNRKDIKNRLAAEYPRAVKQSIPDWLDELGESQIGERWTTELTALNEQAEVVLRTNMLKTNRDELAEMLAGEGIETDTLKNFPEALVLQKRQNIFQSQYFKEGMFEVMDAGSQAIAPFLNAKPGDRVIDACAGAGGKTLHLSALMKNKGKIVAMDTEQWKLDEMSKRARRAEAFNIEARLIDSGKVIKRLENSSDCLLLDVPCSGLGVLRRNPDAKWKLSMEFIQNVNDLQKNILQDYCTMVKTGGKLVYSTCSILPMENENVVNDFLGKNPNYKLEEETRIWPSEGFDGFYMARLIKMK